MRSLPRILPILLLAACTAHNPFNVAPGVDSAPGPGAQQYPPSTKKIRVTASDLPQGTDYVVVERLDVGSGWYGPLEDAEKMMADRARKDGADAVVLVKTWHQPSGFSWAAPHGSGEAVKLAHPESVDLDALPGAWR